MSDLRRVQKTGGSTLIISLPKRWAEANHVNSGDTMELIPGERDTLIIDPHPTETEHKRIKHVTIEDENPEHFFRILIAVYINGYDTIEITSKSPMGLEMREAIRRFTRMVIGPEITEEDKNTVYIKDLSDSGAFGMKSVVRRIFRITYSMLHDSLDAVKDSDFDIARDVISRDTEVDRLYWLLFKQYNTMVNMPGYLKDKPDKVMSLNYFLVGRILERVADHARNISHHLSSIIGTRKKNPLTSDTLKLFSESGDTVLEMLNNCFDSFLKEDFSLANDVIDNTKLLEDLYSKGISRISGSKPEMSIAIAGIMDSVRRAGMYATDIAEIAINHLEHSG